MIILVEGPDGCGKTEISKALSKHLSIPYFKVNSEVMNWHGDTFKDSLYFDAVLPQFIKATGVSFISDRSFISEAVYSRVFNRETRWNAIKETDTAFAKLGAVLLLLVRNDYTEARFDELVPRDKLQSLHTEYLRYCSDSAMKVIIMKVDEYGNSLSQQVPAITEALYQMQQHDMYFMNLSGPGLRGVR